MKYVYVVESFGLHKIGITDDPAQRVAKLALQAAAPVTPVVIFECASAERVELMLHSAFAAKRKHGEWFNLLTDDLRELCRCADVAGCQSRADLVAAIRESVRGDDPKNSARAVLARFLSHPHTAEEILTVFQQLLGELAASGHSSRSMNHDGTLVIQIRNAGRVINAEGKVNLVTVPPPPPPPPLTEKTVAAQAVEAPRQ